MEHYSRWSVHIPKFGHIGVLIEKPRNEWKNDEKKKKIQHGLKDKNISACSLTLDEFFKMLKMRNNQ